MFLFSKLKEILKGGGYYLKKILHLDVSKGLHSLLIVRFMDLVIVGLFFIISFFISASDNITPLLLVVAVLMAFAALVIIIFLDKFVKLGYWIFSKILSVLKLKKFSMVENFEGKFCGACHGSVAFPNQDCGLCHAKPVR